MSKPKKKPQPAARTGKTTPAPAAKAPAYTGGIAPVTLFAQPFWKNYWIAALLLTGICFALYFPTLGYEFVLDDKIVIEDNQYTKKGFAGIREILSTESFQGYFGEQKDLLVGARYRPLSIVTFAIEYQFFGLNPRPGHFTNILLYALSVLLVLAILALLFPLKEGRKWYWSVPFIATLLYVLHPLHTEVVANIKGRDEIMTMMGAFGAMYLTLKYIHTNKSYWLVASGLVFFLALLSKENALTFLAVIPATTYFFTKTPLRKNLTSLVPLLIASVVYLVIRYQVIGYFLSSGKEVTSLMNNPFVEMTSSEKFATIFYTLGLYFKLMFFPHSLTHDYYPYQIPIMNWGKAGTLLSFVLYAGLALVAAYGWKRKWLLSYAIWFYLATISIVSNMLFPVGTFMNERFIYISSFAFCLIGAWFAVEQIPKYSKVNWKGISLIGLALTFVFATGFTWKTIDRIPAWKDGYTLNSEAIKVSVNSARANNFMGTAIFNKYKEETDEAKKLALLDEAEPYIDRALEIHPIYGDGLTMKAGVAAERYRYDRDIQKLLPVLETVVSRRPMHKFANEYLDYLVKQPEMSSLMEDFTYRVGYELYFKKQRRTDLALHFLSKGLTAAPSSAKLNAAAAAVYEASGDQARAAEFMQRARSVQPGIQLQ